MKYYQLPKDQNSKEFTLVLKQLGYQLCGKKEFIKLVEDKWNDTEELPDSFFEQ
jgi:hypothetical protein